MNNTDLINQMNWMTMQNAVNSTLYYASEECSNIPATDTEVYIAMGLIVFTVLLVLFTLYVTWDSFRN